MRRVLTAAVLVPLVLLLLFKAPDWLYSGVIGVVAMLATHEFFGLARRYQGNIYFHGYAVEVAVGLFFLGHALHNVSAFGMPEFGDRFEFWAFAITGYRVLPLFLLVLGFALKDLRELLPCAGISYLGFAYIALTLGAISTAGHWPNGRIVVFIFLLVVWCGDIFAYYVGRAYGQHKLAPSISPGKSWEGAIASSIAAVVVCCVLFQNTHHIGNILVRLGAFPSRSMMYADAPVYPVPWWLAAAFGLCVNVAAQVGDLVESALKRGAGVKDSGSLLPGHGGILDRIDAMLFAAPVLSFFFFVLYQAMIHKP
jgi:phosphatidate cytidylyltransferase